MMFESREEELARKLAYKEWEDTEREIVHLIHFEIDPVEIASVVKVTLSRVLAVAEREGYTPKVEGSIKLIKEGEE